MADDERHDEKHLELPSLRSVFRRRTSPPVDQREAAATSATAPRPAPAPEPDEAQPAEPSRPRARLLTMAGQVRRIHLRVHVPGPLAALVTGAVVGVAMVGLTTATLRLCSSMRGTSSCGTPGILLLLLITLLAILLGSLLLRVLDVGSHGSTSFLGVGLSVVLILLALLPVLDRWWVVVVVPLVAMLSYLASWWITSTYVEPGERPR